MKFLSFAANKILGSSILPMADSTSTSITGNTILSNVLSLLSSGVTVAGGVIIVWGAVQVGLAIKDNQGANMEKGILTIVGGAVLTVAALWFKTVV